MAALGTKSTNNSEDELTIWYSCQWFFQGADLSDLNGLWHSEFSATGISCFFLRLFEISFELSIYGVISQKGTVFSSKKNSRKPWVLDWHSQLTWCLFGGAPGWWGPWQFGCFWSGDKTSWPGTRMAGQRFCSARWVSPGVGVLWNSKSLGGGWYGCYWRMGEGFLEQFFWDENETSFNSETSNRCWGRTPAPTRMYDKPTKLHWWVTAAFLPWVFAHVTSVTSVPQCHRKRSWKRSLHWVSWRNSLGFGWYIGQRKRCWYPMHWRVSV